MRQLRDMTLVKVLLQLLQKWINEWKHVTYSRTLAWDVSQRFCYNVASVCLLSVCRQWHRLCKLWL